MSAGRAQCCRSMDLACLLAALAERRVRPPYTNRSISLDWMGGTPMSTRKIKILTSPTIREKWGPVAVQSLQEPALALVERDSRILYGSTAMVVVVESGKVD